MALSVVSRGAGGGHSGCSFSAWSATRGLAAALARGILETAPSVEGRKQGQGGVSRVRIATFFWQEQQCSASLAPT